MITELTNKLNVKAEDNVLVFGRLNEACGQFVNIDFDDKIIDALVKNKAGFDKISLSYDEKNGVVEDVTSKLLCLCNKQALVLINSVPIVDRIRSNGTIKLNKEQLVSYFKDKIDVRQYWFMNETEEAFE